MVKDYTRNGICLNLKESVYICELDYITFYFSSQQYLNKFNSTYQSRRKYWLDFFHERLKMDFDLTLLMDIMTYRTIEKRGFLIKYNGELLELWQVSLRCGGEIKTKSDCLIW